MAITLVSEAGYRVPDGRRVRGDKTREKVLEIAVQLASAEGLDSLSIGQLAHDARLSKSGVAALFGPKENLQLAVIEHARKVFREAVLLPPISGTVAGHPLAIDMLWETCQRWLDHSRQRVFRGGCFFLAVAAEFDSRPGPVRSSVESSLREWDEYLLRLIEDAISAGQLPADSDSAQILFEINALYAAANGRSLLYDDGSMYDRAASGIRRILVRG